MSDIITENKAKQILDSLSIRKIPIPIEEILLRFNIVIGEAPSNEYSGLLIRKENGALIGLNSDEPYSRKRFTIAHELGHFLFDLNSDAFVDRIEYRDNKSNTIKNPKESRADMFAAALLMPSEFIKNDFAKIKEAGIFLEEHLQSLADKYAVSKLAMWYRLTNLGLIKKVI